LALKFIFVFCVDKSGTVEFNEFIELMAPRMFESNEDDMLEAFKTFDRNGDGFISAEELRSVMKSMGQQLSAKEVEDMVKAADQNGDGRVDYHEFVKMMKQNQ
jgi:calmodulin